jgi:nucleoside-diphosphate-sugar epimerase|tara:strand:+ start:1540 stop:2469 length:930 start_codon:yes stop_codon:yes gene_type:complete
MSADKKNIAIVGGSGFIGSHTAAYLLNNGYNVVIIDLKESELINHSNKPLYIKCDATNLKELKNIFNNIKFDAVFMLAAISNSEENLKCIPNSINQNVLSLTNVLECVRLYNIPRIIFSSTVWVYSVTKSINVNETTNLPINRSNHIYTTCKLMCEQLIQNYSSLYDIKYTILRYGVAYGPGCHPDTILSTFINNVLKNKTCNITGNGSIYRNFLYVTDHANANLLSLSKNAENKIINIDGSECITLNDIADTIKNLHGNIKVKYTDKRAGDYKGKIVSNKRSKKLLNWEPKVNFKMGSKLLYEYLKNI